MKFLVYRMSFDSYLVYNGDKSFKDPPEIKNLISNLKCSKCQNLLQYCNISHMNGSIYAYICPCTKAYSKFYEVSSDKFRELFPELVPYLFKKVYTIKKSKLIHQIPEYLYLSTCLESYPCQHDVIAVHKLSDGTYSPLSYGTHCIEDIKFLNKYFPNTFKHHESNGTPDEIMKGDYSNLEHNDNFNLLDKGFL